MRECTSRSQAATMFSSSNHSGAQKYSQVSVDSDSDSSDDHHDDFIQREIRNQKVRLDVDVE